MPKAKTEANMRRWQQFINRDRLRCVYFYLLAFKLQIVTLAEHLVQNKEATN
jgi:hypothetical protein